MLFFSACYRGIALLFSEPGQNTEQPGIIRKFFINDAKLHKQIEENKKNPKPVSGWQKKLADMQKQNEVRATGRAKK